MIELNRAVAHSYAVGPLEALELLEGMERKGVLEEYAPFHLARADLFRRLGRRDEARGCYRRALPLAQNDRIRRFVERRLEEAGR